VSGRAVWTLGVVAALLFVGYLSHRIWDVVGSRVDGLLVETTEISLDTLLITLAAAVLWLVWDVSAELETLGPDTGALGVQVVVSLVVLGVTYGLTRILARTIRTVADGRAITDHRRDVAVHVVQITAYSLAVLAVLSVWQVNLANLLVGAGFLGVVVGLAARQTLGGVIAGLVLLFSRPFDVGDWVEIGDSEGVVTEVNVYNTQLRSYDGEYVLIPNDEVTRREVVNRSRRGRLRVTVEVGVDYGTDLGVAIAVAREAMAGHDDVLDEPAPTVVATGFGDSAVLLELRFWIDDPTAPKLWTTRSAVVEAVKAAFEEEGVEIPFPQRVVSSRSGESLAGRGDAEVPGGDPDGSRPSSEDPDGSRPSGGDPDGSRPSSEDPDGSSSSGADPDGHGSAVDGSGGGGRE